MSRSVRIARWGVPLAIAAPIVAGAWALAPLSRPELEAPAPTERASPTPTRPLDDSAFGAPLWVAPPPPPPEPAKIIPPPPLRFELLAIVRDGESLEAIIHDLDSDQIRLVGVGTPLGLATVDRIGDAEITLRDPAGTRTVALARPGSTP